MEVKYWQLEDAETGEKREVRIGACTSVPRLAFTAHWGQVFAAFANLDIPIIKATGYSWGACLQRSMNSLIEAGCDWIITIDHDSIFNQDDVLRLLTLAARYDEADVIFPWQIKRGGVDRTLFFLRDENDKPLDFAPAHIFQGELVPAHGGHFGLTLIKVSALKKVPKPWLWEQPNSDGEWTEGKEDADIYFWRKFREAGNGIFLANEIRIGHIDEDILWPAEDFTTYRQGMYQFYRDGKPDLSTSVPTPEPPKPADPTFTEFVNSVKLYNHTSQHGEDAALEAIFRRVGTKNKWCLECGAADGLFFSNTHKLISEGWHAVLIEGDAAAYEKLRERYAQNENVHCVKETVCNVPGRRLEDVLRRVGAPEDLDLMVLDVDGQEYHLWNSMATFRPRVVVIEFGPKSELNFIPELNGPGQAGMIATYKLACGKYYNTVGRTSVNLICVTNEIAPLLADNVKLNLGAGKSPLPGYTNIDHKTGGEVFPLLYADKSALEVRASHILEHFPHGQVASVVKEWARVLKPGGRLKIAVPDFDYIVKAYSNGHRGNPLLEGYLFGGQVDGDDYHKAFFNEEKLKKILEGAGLTDVKRWQADAQDCSSLPVSLNLEARKPKSPLEFLERAKGVIHVGANVGEERDVYAGLNLPVFWIEADPDACQRLLWNIGEYPNQRARRSLITDTDGDVHVFHVANNGGKSSSMFELGQHKQVWPNVEYVSSFQAEGVTLETALRRDEVNLDEYDALVLDVQGAELLVLKGAEGILDKFKFIQCEAAEFELYKGGCQLKDLDEFLTARGWKRSQTWPYSQPGTTNKNGLYEAVYEKE